MPVHRLLSSALLLTAAALGILRPSRPTNLTPASAEGTVTRRVIGYIPSWIRKNGYSTSDIDFSTVTHIAHFSVVPRADGSIEIPDWGPFPDPELVNVAHAHRTPILLVVGGDHEAATDGFSAMAATPLRAKRLSSTLCDWCASTATTVSISIGSSPARRRTARG